MQVRAIAFDPETARQAGRLHHKAVVESAISIRLTSILTTIIITTGGSYSRSE
jgi:hypothetical protein